MASKEELRTWLQSDKYNLLVIQDERGRQKIYCKLPKNGRFDYLFAPRFCATEITRDTELEQVGIYDKEQKLIYDSLENFAKIDPDIEYPKHSTDMQDELTERVCALIDRRVDNNSENLETSELSGREKEQFLSYGQHVAEKDARKAFLEGKTSRDIKYECWYSSDEWNYDEDLLSYIDNPEAYAERESKKFFEKNQQDILLTLKKNELLKAELRKLEQTQDTPLHRLREIISATKNTMAKTLNITAEKEGKKLSFKMEANALSRDPITYYNSWDMSAKDRRAFENTFGARNHLYPEDIVDISYCGKSIYSAEPYEVPVATE